MNTANENESVYARLKPEIDEGYPHGWYVGIADGRVIAAAQDFRELLAELRAQGRDPRHVFVVEAGVSYPDYVTIFM